MSYLISFGRSYNVLYNKYNLLQENIDICFVKVHNNQCKSTKLQFVSLCDLYVIILGKYNTTYFKDSAT